MKLIGCFLLIFGMGILMISPVAAQEVQPDDSVTSEARKLSVAGYLKMMPSWQWDNLSDASSFGMIVHNRFNFSYTAGPDLQFAAGLRNRYITGTMAKKLHGLMRDMLEEDQGLVDLSVVPVAGHAGLWHLHTDRLYADWKRGKWQVRLGRQRINWGINMISNPNDLFNNYSFFDFDYEERPGADALRVTRFTGPLSRAEIAIGPAADSREMVAAALYGFNRKGYDFQMVGGYFRHKAALGAGWAGNLRSSGFKGELTLFSPLDQPDSLTLVCAVGFDHMFSSGAYVLAELLYNGGYTGTPDLMVLNEPMRSDNLFISKYAATVNIMYPISPLLAASLAFMVMPDISASYIMPNLTWSAARNLDLGMVVQYFRFNDYAGMGNLNQVSVYLQGKWSF